MSTYKHIVASDLVNTQGTKFFRRVTAALGGAAGAAAMLGAAPSPAAVLATADGLAPIISAPWAPTPAIQMAPAATPSPGSFFAAMLLRQQAGADMTAPPVPSMSATLQPAVFASPIYFAPTPEPVTQSTSDPDLFGSVALVVGRTPEDAKWIRARDFTPSAGAGPWAEVVQRARALAPLEQLATINVYVNHRIAYATPEAQYGTPDYWATAQESLRSGRGNCTAYAIAKLELLRAAGVPAKDLYLVLVKDLVRRADHAIVAVRLNGRFMILDSGADEVLSQDDVRDYRPILTYGYGRTWIHGYRQTPRVIMASTTEPPFAAAFQ